MKNNENEMKLPEYQKNMVHLLVKKTLEKYKVKPNKNLTSEEKATLRTIYEDLQKNVNELIQKEGSKEKKNE